MIGIEKIIEAAVATDDEPYNDSLDASEDEEDKIATLSNVVRILWKHLGPAQREAAIREIEKG